MRFFTKFGVHVFACVVFVTSSFSLATAQEPDADHLAAAKRAIVASKSTNRLDTLLPRTADNIKSRLIRNQPDADQQITVIVDESAIELAGRRGDLENEVAQIFTRVFTQAELEEIATFFESATGEKFLLESPVIVREIDRAAQVWNNGIQRDLLESVRAKMTEAGLQ